MSIRRSLGRVGIVSSIVVALTILATPTASHAKWELQQEMVTAFDMTPGGVGLLAISPTAPYIARKTPTNLVGITTMPAMVTALSIQDKDVAFAVVKDSGIYVSSNNWQTWRKADTASTTKILLTTSFANVFQTATKARYYYQGSFYDAFGAGEILLAADYTADSTVYAISKNRLFISKNYGREWGEVGFLPPFANGTFYIDRERNIMYLGGDRELNVSTDRGKTWKAISKTSNGDATYGKIFGAPDCSGTFYIAGMGHARKEILVSNTQAKFFQAVGENPHSVNTQALKAKTFNKGNEIYWLDESLRFFYSPDGVDGSAIDSAGLYVRVEPEVNAVLRICREQSTTIDASFSNSDCVPVVIDSMRQLTGIGKLFAPLGAFTVGDESSVARVMTYSSTRIGWDTIRVRAYLHSSQGIKKEFTDFTVIVRTLSDPPEMTLSANDIQFGEVKLQDQKSLDLVIKNDGCDSLSIDSVASSYPEIFTVTSVKPTPFKVGKGQTATFKVIFKPIEEGPFLEAIEIGTNGGHRFISLYGIGAEEPNGSVDPGAHASLQYYPNPFSSELHIKGIGASTSITIFDMHGRVVYSGNSSEDELTLELKHLSAGSYLLQVGSQRSKLIKE